MTDNPQDPAVVALARAKARVDIVAIAEADTVMEGTHTPEQAAEHWREYAIEAKQELDALTADERRAIVARLLDEETLARAMHDDDTTSHALHEAEWAGNVRTWPCSPCLRAAAAILRALEGDTDE